jgi:hypothetical protein
VEHKKSSNPTGRVFDEFEGLIDDDGRIAVPSELLKHFAGKKLRIRLNKEEVSSELRENNVTDEEIERISSLQLESREQVVKFLLSEGVLQRTSAFAKRVRGTKR